MASDSRTLIIAGGGTGGHVLAGVAVADAWRSKWGPDSKILFVGAEGGIEEKLVPRAGYPLELLRLGSLNQVSWKRKMKTFIQLPLSFLRSLSILISTRPSAVLGVGGYASGPLVLLARAFSRTAILEQNAVPGITNRILGRFAHQIFCAFPVSEQASGFSSGKTRVTGNPIRSAIRPLPPAPRDPFCVFIFGGSQGAVGVNTLVLDAITQLGNLKDRVCFVHQTGEKDYERVLEGHRKAGTHARVEKFIYDMPQAYADASLLICRSGSSTLAEIAAVGRASVLVPFPAASDNHQEKNARVFVDAGAAYLLSQKNSTGADLARILRDVITDPSKLTPMENAVSRFYKPDAAVQIVQEISSS